MITASTATVTGFYLAAKLPTLLSAALLFLTPIAFLMSTLRNSRMLVDRLALGLRARARAAVCVVADRARPDVERHRGRHGGLSGASFPRGAAMSALSGEYAAYLALILAGFLPNEVWRWLGVVFARGLDEDSEIVVWVRAVATAILAGVIAKLTIFAPGVLATVPTPVRLGAVSSGFLAFTLIRRSVFAGVMAGEAALIVGALVFG